MATGFSTRPYTGVGDSQSTMVDLGTTAAEDLSNAAGGTVYAVELDAKANTGEVCHFRLHNARTYTPANTDVQGLIIPTVPGKVMTCICRKGFVYGTGLSAACTQEAGGKGEAITAPSGQVNVKMLFTSA
jgi:hypothetical protein